MAMQLARTNSSFGRCSRAALPRGIYRGPQRRHLAVYVSASASSAEDGARTNLQEAAELLVKAAIEQSQTTGSSAALSKEAVAELKRIAAFTQTTAAKLEGQEALLKDVAAASREVILTLKAAVLAASQEKKSQAVTQTLQWAITNASIGEFSYDSVRNGFRDSNVKSSSLVKETLLVFMKGIGRLIPNEYYVGSHNENPTRQAFRDALSEQIHLLTGVKPRIVLEKNGHGEVDQYAIYRV